MRYFFKTAALMIITSLLTACGTFVPPISYTFNDDADAGVFVNELSNYVRCELRKAVQEVETKNPGSYPWLDLWSAEVTLTLTITEKTTLTPGAIVTDLIPSSTTKFSNGTSVVAPQTFNLGVAFNYNNTAVRTTAITWFVLFHELLHEKSNTFCENHGGHGLESDLRLKETLIMGLFTAKIQGGVSQPFKTGGPLQNIQDTISFDVDAGGNITPSWKLVRVAANSTGTFLGGDRDRKDQLLITMGPAELATEAKGRQIIPSALAPSSEVGAVHNIGRINSQLQTP